MHFTPLFSVVTYTVVCPKIFVQHIWTFFKKIKIHVLVKEVYLKSIKWKLSKITSFTLSHISFGKIHRMKTDFLRRFIMGHFYIFYPFGKYLKIIIFSTFISFWSHRILLIFSRMLTNDKLERGGGFKGGIGGFFSYYWINIVWTQKYLFI